MLSDVGPWTFGWEALVAIGTSLLALATFVLALAALREAAKVAEQAVAVAEQVALQRAQTQAALRPVVYPITPADWAMGGGVMAQRRRRLLPVANGGPGVALNVMGHLMQRPERGGGYRSAQILAGSVGPGAEQDARLEQEWPEWEGTIGYLRYWDVLGNEWYTDFSCNIADGGQLSIEAKPPRRASEPGPEYPPADWN